MTIHSDKIWRQLRDEVSAMVESEESLTEYLNAGVLRHATIEQSLAHILSCKLVAVHFKCETLQKVMNSIIGSSEHIQKAFRCDLVAIVNRDPAAKGFAEPFLHYKGFHALEAYRVSNVLWNTGRRPLALYIHSRVSEVFAVDIHPAARIGSGILIDHATSVVIGETAVVGDNVSMLHEVTLGGTGKEQGDRHPKVGRGVLIGAGAKILGNIKIGDGSKIGAGSVVLEDVPEHTTAVGVPARVVGHPKTTRPALSMDQTFDIETQIDNSYISSAL